MGDSLRPRTHSGTDLRSLDITRMDFMKNEKKIDFFGFWGPEYGSDFGGFKIWQYSLKISEKAAFWDAAVMGSSALVHLPSFVVVEVAKLPIAHARVPLRLFCQRQLRNLKMKTNHVLRLTRSHII